MNDADVIQIEGSDRSFSRRRILIVVLLPIAMSLMAVSAVNVALPTIEQGLGASPSDIQWVLSGYGLAFGMSLIPSGRLGDARGRGGFLVLGVVLFTVGSLLCGLAPTPLVLNLFRLVQGIGSGLIGPQVTGLIMQYYDGPERARAFSLFGLVVSASVVVGPLLAGVMIDLVGPKDGWRAAFIANVPLGLIEIALALAWLPFEAERLRKAGRALGIRPPRADLDPLGALLVSLAVLAIMIPFMTTGGWIWLALPAGLGLLVAWAFWERHYAQRGREPMVRMDLFLFRSFSYGTAVSATQFLGGTSVFVCLALFVQGAGASALTTGLLGLPNAIASAYFSLWAGRRAFTNGRRLIIAGLASILAGVAGTAAMAPAVSSFALHYFWLSVPLVLMGLGVGCLGSPNQTLSLEDIPVRFGGSAGAVKQTAERTATAIGNAMMTAIFFGVSGAAGMLAGFLAAYGAISVAVLVALLLAIADRRSALQAGKTY